MKDASPRFLSVIGTRSSLPFVCGIAVVCTIFLGLITVPYLSSSLSPQQLVSIHQIYKILTPTPLPPPIIEKQEECQNLFEGEWIFDPEAALYRNDSCSVLSQAQNCQGNGRPDKRYESWRWSPRGCNLPRLNATTFLELLRGKVIAFVGDSVTRNHMESLMCIFMQVETPVNRGNHKMQKWFFPKHSVTVVRLWSSWLVRSTPPSEPPHLEGVPNDLARLHIDHMDDNLVELLPRVDILVVSTGHWFAKKSAYILNGQLVGWQGWSPTNKDGKHVKPEMDNVAAFAVCVETALRGILMHPDYKGLTILRTYSPDHYEGGAWNSGGSCTGKVKPLQEPDGNRFTQHMRDLQVAAFDNVTRQFSSSENGHLSKMRLLDVTLMSSYRADGHPGPFRSPDPGKQTVPGPDGHPPPQDCLHWCLPGPIDTWNHLLFHVIKASFPV